MVLEMEMERQRNTWDQVCERRMLMRTRTRKERRL
jgi:hypothetical protein